MYRRTTPKARERINEEAATGRRRQHVCIWARCIRPFCPNSQMGHFLRTCNTALATLPPHPHQVHHESSRQRDHILRARRLQTELTGAVTGDVSEAALASLGSDVLVPRAKALAAALQECSYTSPSELLSVLQQLVALLSTGRASRAPCRNSRLPAPLFTAHPSQACVLVLTPMI